MICDLVFLTCDRKQPGAPYIHDSLRSLFAGAPDANLCVRLVVDGAEARYVYPWGNHPAVTVECADDDTLAALAELPTIDRITRNYHRLLCGADLGSGGPLVAGDLLRHIITFEDDVVFAPGWWRKTCGAVQALEHQKGLRYMLSLYCPFPYIKTDQLDGFYDTSHGEQFVGEPARPYAVYDIPRYYGMCALLMPTRVAAELRDYIGYRLDAGQLEPVDMMVRRFLATTATPLFAINPNVVDHVGAASTWCDARPTVAHSPSFRAAYGQA